MVSNTTEDFPEPETPVKIVICRFGMRSVMSLRLFSRAPRISMYSVMDPRLAKVARGCEERDPHVSDPMRHQMHAMDTAADHAPP
jgi:hypothetical protein